ncbi:MAG: hypothetical protein GXP14_06060 [Gammaproteobacteria bacterium]|nr:hypothetical protein [Gammaproteobacteria bacterium]
MIPNNKIPSLSYPIQNGNANKPMDEISRTKAKAALHSLIQDLRNSPDKYARLVDAKDPLPEELPSMLMLLDEVCRQLTHPDYKSNKNDTIDSVKQICSTARVMRQILHGSKASDYRALGLNSKATQEQIHNHYRWLNTLFSFDETIDPKHHSIRRIMQAYISLTNSGLQHEEDNTPQLASNQALITTQEMPLWYPDPKAHERKYSGIALSTIVLLTLSAGLGWWWLLDSADTEKVEQTTAFNEAASQKTESQEHQNIIQLTENPSHAFNTDPSSDIQKETDIEELQKQPIQSAVSSINLDETISASDQNIVKTEPDEHLSENRPAVIAIEGGKQSAQPTDSPVNLDEKSSASDRETVQAEADQHSAENQPAIAVVEEQPISSAISSLDLGEEASASDLDTTKTEPDKQAIEKQPTLAAVTQKTNNINEKKVGSKIESAAPTTMSIPEEKNTMPSEQTRNLVSTKDKAKTQADAAQKKNRLQIQPVTFEKQNINPPFTPLLPSTPSVALKIQPSRIAVENEFDNTPNSQALKKDIDIEKTTPVAAINKPIENSLMEMMLVIGSPDLEIDRLSKEQVENIFLGKMTMLPNGQKIKLFDQQDGNTIKRNFYAAVTGKTPRQIKAHWSKLQFRGLVHPPESLMNDQATKERIATSKFAIGYINGASLDNSVKVLRSFK